jgi:hypothetical protein
MLNDKQLMSTMVVEVTTIFAEMNIANFAPIYCLFPLFLVQMNPAPPFASHMCRLMPNKIVGFMHHIHIFSSFPLSPTESSNKVMNQLHPEIQVSKPLLGIPSLRR